MKFARAVFLIAGIYGVLILTPIYFMEGKIGRETPPAITHPEYFYGFLGAGLAWQILFLVLSRDPLRYRAMILPSILEKVSYGIALVLLFAPQASAFGAHDWFRGLDICSVVYRSLRCDQTRSRGRRRSILICFFALRSGR